MLEHPSGTGTLVDHLVALASVVGGEAVLVGEGAAYADLGLRMLPDARTGAGPLAGLESLMRAAGPRLAYALACDMPFVPLGLLRRLHDELLPEADAVMPVRGPVNRAL